MARCDDDYVTMDQIVSLVSQQLGEVTPSTALSGPLRALKSSTFGSILADIESSKEGQRVYNYSAFSDPAMKSIIRMVIQLESETQDEKSELSSIAEVLKEILDKSMKELDIQAKNLMLKETKLDNNKTKI